MNKVDERNKNNLFNKKKGLKRLAMAHRTPPAHQQKNLARSP